MEEVPTYLQLIALATLAAAGAIAQEELPGIYNS